VNANGPALIRSVSIAEMRLNGNEYDNLNTHHLEPDDQGSGWVWEILCKSGDNHMLFHSEIGHDDQMFHAVSKSGIPAELLSYARSFEVPAEGIDRRPVDLWGQLLIFDRGRELLP